MVESKYYLGGKRIPYLLSFLFINILAGALGIRFYMAVALFTKGLTLYLFRGRFNSAVIFLFLSVMFHFSAALPIIALFTSRIVKLKYRFVPFYFLMGFVFGSFLLLDIINSGVLGYLGQYIKSGYIDFSTNADVDTKGNAIVVTVWRYFILLFLYIPCYKLYNKKNDDTGFLNFIGVYFVICSLTAISFNAFNRYIIAYGSFFVLLNCFIVMNFRVKKIQINIFIFILVFNFLFQNIYLQRRPILFGEMWKGLYMPFLINIEKSDYDFKIQMNQIDENGDWIKDRVASE
ncbi:EpsG family protein [Tatumella sp. JGM130]|uniref:EpsG family protein n=1 Tax=Tatumella sp. JGM130 TaxID=2799797 RepID=UPI00352CCC5D